MTKADFDKYGLPFRKDSHFTGYFTISSIIDFLMDINMSLL